MTQKPACDVLVYSNKGAEKCTKPAIVEVTTKEGFRGLYCLDHLYMAERLQQPMRHL